MLRNLPKVVHLQLLATLLNSAGGIIKLFMPLFFYEVYKYDLSVISLLMAAYGCGCILGAYAGGVLSERFDSQWLTSLSLMLSGVFAAILALQPSLPILFVVVPLVGIFDGAFRPANLRLIMEACPEASRLHVQGLHRVVFNLGIASAGVLAGMLVSLGYSYVFLIQGLANLFGSLCLFGYAIRHAGRGRSMPAVRVPLQFEEACSQPDSPWKDKVFLVFILGQLLALGVFDRQLCVVQRTESVVNT